MYVKDSLSIDGNILGQANPDGVPDFLDHFDDGSLITPPTGSFMAASSLAESGGFLRFRDTDGSLSNSKLNLDIAILEHVLTDGAGNSEIKASFRGDDPAPARFYGPEPGGRSPTTLEKPSLLEHLDEIEDQYLAIERLGNPAKRWSLGESGEGR